MSQTSGKRNKTSARVAIREYYLKGTELSEKQEGIRQRWTAAFTLLCSYHSIQQAIPVHRKTFDVSEGQAYRDMKEALQLFGDVMKTEKEGYRQVVYEYAIKTFQLAAKNGDYKAMNQAVTNMMKLQGLDREDPDLPDFEKMKPSINIITIPDAIKKLLEVKLNRGPVIKKMEDYTDYESLE
jgi:hypothetical protein